MYQELQRSAEYDPLTSLANHSKLSRELDTALLDATSVHPCVAVMFDVVNFGRFNETYGYAEGDEVLRRIARALVEFEDADSGVSVARFGGDVFLVVLRDATRERAAALPDVPTAIESGIRNYEVIGWFGLLAPAGTSQPLVLGLQTGNHQCLERQAVVTRDLGIVPHQRIAPELRCLFQRDEWSDEFLAKNRGEWVAHASR